MKAIFFPKNEYPLNEFPGQYEICAHRLGKKMTYTDNTDGLRLDFSYYPYLTISKKYNIKVSSFYSYYDYPGNFSDVIDDINNGHLWVDVYSLCPSLYDAITKPDHRPETTEEWIRLFNNGYTNELLPKYVSIFGKKTSNIILFLWYRSI